MERPRVLAVGRFGATVAALVPALPDSATPDELAASAVVPGGLGLTLRTVVRLGCAGHAVGYVGSDALGSAVHAELTAGGIDCRRLRADGVTPLQIALVTLDGPRRLRSRPASPVGGGAADELAPLMGDAAAVIVDGTEPPLQQEVARLARAAGVPVIARLHGASDAERDLIAECAVLVVSERVAGELAPRGELEDALAHLQQLGPRLVVITRASDGVLARQGRDTLMLPARQTDVLDGSGAGDVLLGGLVAGLVSELPVRACLDLGITAAGLACQSLGVWHGVPSRDALLSAMGA